MTTRELRNAAADLIEHGRWFQDGIANRAGSHCVWTAMMTCCGDDGGFCIAASIEMGFEPSVSTMGVSRQVFDWNDAPERTKAEVIARLRAASVRPVAPQGA